VLVFLLGVIAAGLLSIARGQDNNWDLRNYHYYNPYSFLHDRLKVDIAPAQLQTYFNPLTELPFYALITSFAPKTAAFLMGGLHGLCFGLIFLIAWLVFASFEAKNRLLLSLACALFGLYGPTFVGEIGASQNDITVSLFVLLGLYWIFRPLADGKKIDFAGAKWAVMLSGLVIGFGIGLKPTHAIYAVGLGPALLLAGTNWTERIKLAVVWGVCVAAGILLSGGYWMLVMQREFGNPLFPNFNHIFQSPYLEPKDIADLRSIPRSFAEALYFPFEFLVKSFFTWTQRDFRDSRYAIIYVLAVLFLISWLMRKYGAKPPAKKSAKSVGFPVIEQMLLVMFVLAFVVWEKKFAALRYLEVLEALSPILIISLTRQVFRSPALQGIFLTVAAVLLIAFNRPEGYERVPFSDRWWDLQVPSLQDPDHAMVVIAGGRPWAYLIPSFPKTVRFIRAESNFTSPKSQTKLQQGVREAIQTQQGPIYMLSSTRFAKANLETVKAYGLNLGDANGLPITMKYAYSSPDGDLYLWPLTKNPQP
jgi:hypothetical protein